eukprot:scaffold127268_cov23-Tisochrysis_lutea.AAC.1
MDGRVRQYTAQSDEGSSRPYPPSPVPACTAQARCKSSAPCLYACTHECALFGCLYTWRVKRLELSVLSPILSPAKFTEAVVKTVAYSVGLSKCVNCQIASSRGCYTHSTM